MKAILKFKTYGKPWTGGNTRHGQSIWFLKCRMFYRGVSAPPSCVGYGVIRPGRAYTVVAEGPDWWQIRWHGTTIYVGKNLPYTFTQPAYDEAEDDERPRKLWGQELPRRRVA